MAGIWLLGKNRRAEFFANISESRDREESRGRSRQSPTLLLSLSVENYTESLEEWHGMLDHPRASVILLNLPCTLSEI